MAAISSGLPERGLTASPGCVRPIPKSLMLVMEEIFTQFRVGWSVLAVKKRCFLKNERVYNHSCVGGLIRYKNSIKGDHDRKSWSSLW